MKLINNLLLTIITIIFAVLVLVGIYQIIILGLHHRIQTSYRNHNEWYSSRCLGGCNRHKKCPYGNLCFNCSGENPSCCCYDSQCSKC